MKHVEIIGAESVSVPFFCDTIKLLTKHFGKDLMIRQEKIDLVRQAASILEMLGKECQLETREAKAKAQR